MNLSEPAFDAILGYDKRLQELQNEVRGLEQQYGFSEQHVEIYQAKKKAPEKTPQPSKLVNESRTGFRPSAKTTTTTPNKSKVNISNISSKDPNASRYKNLPKVQVDEAAVVKQTTVKPKPEIDPEWKKANKKKPNLNVFWEKETFQPTYTYQRDFESKPNFCGDYGYFYDYMSNFALSYSKNVKV